MAVTYNQLLASYQIMLTEVEHLLSPEVSGPWQKQWKSQAKTYHAALAEHKRVAEKASREGPGEQIQYRPIA